MSYKAKRICKYGHDTAITGRNQYNICIMCCRKRQIVYEHKNPLRKRDFQWKARGVKCTEDFYESLRSKQNKCCAICEKHESNFKTKLAVDHNHQTGKIRGLLCMYCNRIILPLVETRPIILEKAKKYLENDYVN